MKFLKQFVWIVALALLVSTGCENDSDDPQQQVPVGYSQGVFIVNEGPFQTGTGTITFMNRDASQLSEKIFQNANNGLPLGNITQSMNLESTYKTDAYIAVNNANKIEVVDISTFDSIQSIENIPSPRYIEFGGNDKVYITSWDNTVKVLSTVGYEFFGQINVGVGPEKLMRVAQTIWVLNQGGFDVDSTVSIINTQTDQVIETIQVYPKPTGIQVDQNGLVWILCSGKGWNGFPGADDSEAHLLCIDPDSYTVIKDIAFPTSSEHPEKLVINREGDQLFYNFTDGIYRFDIHSNELETSPFIARVGMFYGLGLDRKDNIIYGSDPGDFIQKGWVFRYSATSGNVVDSVATGIVPGEFFFTE